MFSKCRGTRPVNAVGLNTDGDSSSRAVIRPGKTRSDRTSLSLRRFAPKSRWSLRATVLSYATICTRFTWTDAGKSSERDFRVKSRESKSCRRMFVSHESLLLKTNLSDWKSKISNRKSPQNIIRVFREGAVGTAKPSSRYPDDVHGKSIRFFTSDTEL